MNDLPHALALPAGYRLSEYEILRVLGVGGFGITYAARETTLGRVVAVKELLPESIATRVGGSTVTPMGPGKKDDWDWARERFYEEATTLAQFSHPSIVGIQRLVEANGTVYVVMDYIEGESFGQKLQASGKIASQTALMDIMEPLLGGVAEVHSHGLLHRDIKPDNIIIPPRGPAVLIDFGSARKTISQKTMTMTSIVSHGYSPIEQYQTKGRMGPWTDIYSLGAVMYRAITGDKPPTAADRALEDGYECLGPLNIAGYDRKFLSAVDWALKPAPQDRPQSIEAWGKAFFAEAVTESEPPPLPLTESISQSQTIAVEQAPANLVGLSRFAKMAALFVVVSILLSVFGAYVSELLNSPKAAAPLVDRPLTATEFLVEASPVADPLEGVTSVSAIPRPPESRAQALKLGQLPPRFLQEGGQPLEWEDSAVEDFRRVPDWLSAIPAKQREKAMLQRAQKGDVEAQFWLGFSYRTGDDAIKQNSQFALRWLKEAASQGDPIACYDLATMHRNGDGTAKDPAAALLFLTAAAAEGYSPAMYGVAEMYAQGLGAPKDQEKALGWMIRAARADYQPAVDLLKERGISIDLSVVKPRVGGRVFATDEEARAFLYESPEKAQGAATGPNR